MLKKHPYCLKKQNRKTEASMLRVPKRYFLGAEKKKKKAQFKSFSIFKTDIVQKFDLNINDMQSPRRHNIS